MIVIVGTGEPSEQATALAIQTALMSLWPGIDQTPAEEELVQIAPGVKISGYPVADIDVVIAAKFRPDRKFVPRRVLKDSNGKRVTAAITVSSLVAVVEVKDHDPSKTRMIGDRMEVWYSRSGSSGWHNATEQNVKQLHSLGNYLADQGVPVFVRKLLVMRGFEKSPCAGAIGGKFSGAELLTGLCETNPVPANLTLRASANPGDLDKILAASIFKVLKPSSLDRKRMDRIAGRSADLDRYLEILGRKMLRFRGRGGTGKTVMLLQLAWRAFDEQGKRSLLLTYNHALASDIRRLMALMAIPSGLSEGGVGVRTVMSFVSTWLSRLGAAGEQTEWDDSKYQNQCSDALEMIREGTISRDDIERLKAEDPDSFSFDNLIVDEAQDWPQAEIELLKVLYGPARLCLADGVEQLIRGKQANWDEGVAEDSRLTVPLKTCLRMKAGLASFMNRVANMANLNWQVEPNPMAGGGKVIVVLGPLLDQRALIRRLLIDAEQAGNALVDNLFCVPPADVSVEPETGRASRLAGVLQDWGYVVWDGTNERLRRDFPRDINMLRLVQYASCRGLEGWTVFLDELDTMWQVQRDISARQESGDFVSADEAASREAWRFCLMPLSRPIDTLVIGIRSPESEVGKVILKVAAQLPDIVEIVR